MKKKNYSNRVNNMGTLHLIGALFVIYGHHCALLGKTMPLLFGCEIQKIGLKIIFLISGYLITKSLWNIQGNRGKISMVYCIKRLGRIYPEFLVCVLLSAIVVGPIFTNLNFYEYCSNSGISTYITYNLRMFPVYCLPGMFVSNPYPNAVNGSLWTMPVELFLYFLILIIYLISNNETIKKYIWNSNDCSNSTFFIRFVFFPNASVVIYGTDWIQALNIMPYFLIGGVAWLFELDRYMNLQIGAVLMLIFAGGVTLSTSAMNETLCLIILSYFVLSLMLISEQKIKLNFIPTEYAYGMYLYGFVVQQCIVQITMLEKEVNFVNFHITYVISVIVTLTIAMLSYKYVYKPVNRIIGMGMKHLLQ